MGLLFVLSVKADQEANRWNQPLTRTMDHANGSSLRKTYRIPMGDVIYSDDDNGDPNRFNDNLINLKRLIRRHHGRVNLRNTDLVKVRLMAKSKYGWGRVSLTRGNNHYSGGSEVGGNFNQWDSNLRHTFDKVVLNGRGHHGKWLLQFHGDDIMVRKIAVIVRNRDDDDDRWRRTYEFSIGEHKIQKFWLKPANNYSFHVGKRDVVGIKITCTKRDVNINSVKLVLMNGEEKTLHSLRGSLRNGQRQVANFSPHNVSHLVIDAVTPHLKGSRGKIKIDIEKFVD